MPLCHVDYGVSQETLQETLRCRVHGSPILGYEVEHQEEVTEATLRPGGGHSTLILKSFLAIFTALCR